MRPDRLKLAKQMALAVLLEDEGEAVAAACALADLLREPEAVAVMPLRKITRDVRRLRFVAYLADDNAIDQAGSIAFEEDIRRWVASEEHPMIFLSGVERLEIYELPEGTADG